MFTTTFWKDAAERAVATFAQTLIALVGTEAVDILNVTIWDSIAASAVAGVLSVLKAVAKTYAPKKVEASDES